MFLFIFGLKICKKIITKKQKKKKRRIKLISMKPVIPGYKVIKQLGKGYFGTVFQALDTNTQKEIAIKLQQPRPGMIEYEYSKRELATLDKMKELFEKAGPWPESIIQYYKGWQDKDDFYILMELCSDGNLKDLLSSFASSKKKLPQDLIFNILFQMTNGISLLHKNGFIHRDLKPENVLLIQNPIIKIVDYGVSRYEDLSLSKLNLPKGPSALVGSPDYMSPQQLNNLSYSAKCDSWAFGIILLEMMSQKPAGVLSQAIIQMALAGQHSKILTFLRNETKDYCPELSDLICSLLKIDENERIGIEEIQKLPFYQVLKFLFSKKRYIENIF